MSLRNKGRRKTEQEKFNMSKAKKEKGTSVGIKNPKYKGKIYCYQNEVLIREFVMIKDVADYFGLSVSHSTRFIDPKGDRFKTLKGFTLTRKLH